MPDKRRSFCQSCDGHRDDVGLISWSGLCEDCALKKMERNIVGISTRTGPEYLHWVRRSYMATRRQLLAHAQEGT